MFPYDQLPTVPDLTDQIKRGELIGKGGFGSVYKGRWFGAVAGATPVIAIKDIEIVPSTDEAKRTKQFKQITRELLLWYSIKHENILPLLGIARINGDASVPAFVSPWIENGNAREFCSRNPHFPRMLILYDIINGLHYLHTSKPEIVHGDIKAVNVLINKGFKACLCDFGLSRFLTDNTLWKTSATHAGGTLRWMAPELINQDAPTPTKESDIYAYAMTCYEILSGDVPFKSVLNDIAIITKVTKGQRPNRTELFYSDSTWDFITRCWEQEPKARIPTEKVLGLLLEKKEEEVTEVLTKIGEKESALAKVKKEVAVLMEQMAKAEEDLKALKEEKEKVLEGARHDIAEKERELNSLNASLQQSETAVQLLENRVEWLERTKGDAEEKYEKQVEESQGLKEQLEEAVAMHQTKAAELHQETEHARKYSSVLTEELTNLRHTNSSLHEDIERLEREAAEARAREEEAVAVQQKQKNEISRLHEEVTRAFSGAKTTSGNLEKAKANHNQTKDRLDDITSQPEESRREQLMIEVEKALTKIEEKDVGFANLKEEIAALKEQNAEAGIAIQEWKPYASSGSEESLVIGIDVGMKLSCVSYSLFLPGKVIRVSPVQWHARYFYRSDSNVPSVVCYDQGGHVIAVGYETDPEVNPRLSEVEGVRRAERFKLRLLPPHLKARLEKVWSSQVPSEEIDEYAGASDEDEYGTDCDRFVDHGDDEVSKLEPPNKTKKPQPVADDFKTAVQVFVDFLQYLFKSAKKYIIETEKIKDQTFHWASIERNIYFILTHPNGWEGKQQSQMLDAAIAAGIVDRLTAANQITFLTEGKANLHFCLAKIPRLNTEGGGLVVVDGGNETINISAYSQVKKGCYSEIASPDCILPGFISATSCARDYFKERFKGSKFGSEDDVDAMARVFDRAKYRFLCPPTPYYLHFGSTRDFDRKYDISRGKFKVDSTQMAKFFQPAVQDIILGIEKQCRNAKEGVSVKFVLLIGEFAQSDYLYTTLHNHLKSSGIVVLRPPINGLNAAIASGAVYYFVDRFTPPRIVRIAKYSYGIEVNSDFNPADPEHVRRECTKVKNANGDFQVPGGFLTILKKGTTVTGETRFHWPCSMYFTPEEFSKWSEYSMTIKCYKGQAASPPQWLDLEPDSFHDSCIIQADTTRIKCNVKPKNNGTMEIYQFDFEISIFIRNTGIEAYIYRTNNETQGYYQMQCVLLQADPNRMQLNVFSEEKQIFLMLAIERGPVDLLDYWNISVLKEVVTQQLY